jgi:hypothetical protein
MIDNIRVVADDAEMFVLAVRTLLHRMRAGRLTLNDAADWDCDDRTILQRCAVSADVPRVFLGEQYTADTVSNAPHNVDKLRRAMALYEHARDTRDTEYTLRHFASLIGLMIFMGHTLNESLCDSHVLLRAWGTMISQATGWDGPCTVTSEAVDAELTRLARALIANQPVPLPLLRAPSFDCRDYDACMVVDASLSGWGAYVRFSRSGEIVQLRQRWDAHMGHSAHSEPRAATRCVQWIRQQHPGARIALVTDHAAIASGQRRWYSGNGGFSSSYLLNELFRVLYGGGGGEVFFVDGVLNPADGPSRDVSATFALTVTPTRIIFPDLQAFHHPHVGIPRLPHYV